MVINYSEDLGIYIYTVVHDVSPVVRCCLIIPVVLYRKSWRL